MSKENISPPIVPVSVATRVVIPESWSYGDGPLQVDIQWPGEEDWQVMSSPWWMEASKEEGRLRLLPQNSGPLSGSVRLGDGTHLEVVNFTNQAVATRGMRRRAAWSSAGWTFLAWILISSGYAGIVSLEHSSVPAGVIPPLFLLLALLTWGAIGVLPVHKWGGWAVSKRNLVAVLLGMGAAWVIFAAPFTADYFSVVSSWGWEGRMLGNSTIVAVGAGLGGAIWGNWMGGRDLALTASIWFAVPLTLGVLLVDLAEHLGGVPDRSIPSCRSWRCSLGLWSLSQALATGWLRWPMLPNQSLTSRANHLRAAVSLYYTARDTKRS